MPIASARSANLDLLRAVAIAVVVASNAVSEGLVPPGLGARVLYSGWLGVDLFFVLSGWLVGGLYWRELRDTGRVDIGHFWQRRWLRTIPPYLVVLHLVFLIKNVLPGPALSYDPLYLIFGQNYYEAKPYWGVSWSLCVEEHFYLALPLVLLVVRRGRVGIHLLTVGLVALSLTSRLLTTPLDAHPGGLFYTATHNRLEGLALGVWAAYVYYLQPAWWPTVQRVARWLVAPGLGVVLAIPFMPERFVDTVAFTLADIAFAALLVVLADRRPVPGATWPFVRGLALISFSLYMTHTVVLQAYNRLVLQVGVAWPYQVHVLLVGMLALAVGAGCYYAVERPSLALRERLAARRNRPQEVPTLAGPV